MLVLSHLGYHVAVPENTYDAFESALRLGVNGIETDLRLSADGDLILFHDRLTPDGRAIESLSRSALSAAVGYPIPTLEEVPLLLKLLYTLGVSVAVPVCWPYYGPSNFLASRRPLRVRHLPHQQPNPLWARSARRLSR
jgi:glycerophosphoryl diester phosphodiesterase